VILRLILFDELYTKLLLDITIFENPTLDIRIRLIDIFLYRLLFSNTRPEIILLATATKLWRAKLNANNNGERRS